MSGLAIGQLGVALEAFNVLDLERADSVIEGDDLIDNLNLRVESLSFEIASQTEDPEHTDHRIARSALKVAINLERAADAATHISKHIRVMRGKEMRPRPYDFGPLDKVTAKALDDVTKAYLNEDLTRARQACETEPELDRLYVEKLSEVTETMQKSPDQIDYYMHVLAVLKYLEKIGDYVLNIGEQAIFLVTGRRLKFAQFQQLDTLLGPHSEESDFAPFMDGISGAIVARVGNGVPLLYKEGSQRKIDAEIEKSAKWRNIDRDLTPKVLSTVSTADRRALLREWVDGSLLSHVMFENGDSSLQLELTQKLGRILVNLWTKTLVEESPRADFIRQIADRLDGIYAVHPDLRRLATARLRYRGTVCQPLDKQIAAIRKIEPGLAPPFSVWLHGDFNPNNVVYNQRHGGLKFIDIHRSRFGDYLQDVSVFTVGLKREPDLIPTVKRHLRRVESEFVNQVRRFAADHRDRHFETRLLLGLGRSYITSARIILQPAHAEWLFRQGRICLQKVIDRA